MGGNKIGVFKQSINIGGIIPPTELKRRRVFHVERCMEKERCCVGGRMLGKKTRALVEYHKKSLKEEMKNLIGGKEAQLIVLNNEITACQELIVEINIDLGVDAVDKGELYMKKEKEKECFEYFRKIQKYCDENELNFKSPHDRWVAAGILRL